MASASTFAYGSILVVLFLIQQGYSLSCYQCNSHNPDQTRCADKIPPESLKTECVSNNEKQQMKLCRKITQVIEFEVNGLPPDTRVIRGCGWDNSTYADRCYQRSGFGGRQEVCSCGTDGCNSSSLISGSILSLITGIVCVIAFRAL